jgi:hypothetical protein
MSVKTAAPVVIAFGLFLGYASWMGFFGYSGSRYPLRFEKADWIGSVDAGADACFRKEIYISQEVKRAWVKVAAPDDYVLYANGSRVDGRDRISTCVSGVHDLTGRLEKGVNVIAVQVQRKTRPGPALAVVEGAVESTGGRTTPFASDATWKASSVEERQKKGAVRWYARNFDDSRWKPARTGWARPPGPVEPETVNPRIVTCPFNARWIWHPSHNATTAYFTRDFVLPSGCEDAWIRVSGDENYVLLVNDVKTGTGQFGGSFAIQDITPLLRKGRNTIGVKVWGDASVHGLYLEGFVSGRDGSETGIATGRDWKVIVPPTSTDRLPEPSDPSWKEAAPLGDYLSRPWGILSMQVRENTLPFDYQLKNGMKTAAFVLFVSLLVFLLWRVSGAVISRARGVSAAEGCLRDSVGHIAPLLLLLIACGLGYDYRFPADFPFHKAVLAAVVFVFLGLKGWILLENTTGRGQPADRIAASRPPFRDGVALSLILLVVIASLGAFVRLRDLDSQSLSHDEILILGCVPGVFERGYPVRTVGAMEKPATTYELLPYPIAVSSALFGKSDFAVRIPAALFGTLTIVLIFVMGRHMFNRWVGLLAAAVYAFNPWSITMAQNLFHPQQTQFMALMTLYLFYRTFESKEIKPRYLYGSSVFFILTYLGWEGSAFLLPGLFFGLVALRGSDFSWVRSKRLWISLGAVSLVMFFQLARRVLWQVRYTVVGTGVSDISTPRPAFLDPLYNPRYYWDNFLWTDTHAVMTVFLVLGLLAAAGDRRLRYLYAVLISVLLLMTNFLTVYSNVHAYWLQTVLVLTASAVALSIAGRVLRMWKERRSPATAFSTLPVVILLPLWLWVASNTLVVKLYRISGKAPPLQTRREMVWIDYRSAGLFLKSHVREGDIIIGNMSHAFGYYSGRRMDYFLQTFTDRQVFYDLAEQRDRYIDKYIGAPVIRSLGELQDVLWRNRRVWVATSSAFFSTNDEATLDYLAASCTVACEGYATKVYLWEQ